MDIYLRCFLHSKDMFISQILIQVLLTTVVVFSDEQNDVQSKVPTVDPNYQAGLAAYQESKFDVAKEKFLLVWSEEPQNPLVNYNLGLAEFKLGQRGRALAFWRRAQEADPFLSLAQDAEEFGIQQLKVKALPHRITVWETYRNAILKQMTLDTALMSTALILLLFGYLGFKYWGQRRDLANEDNDRFAPMRLTNSPIILSLVGFLFLASAATAAMKYFDLRVERATVVVEKIEARSGPSEDQASLFDLFEGLEVIVRQSFEDTQAKKWKQVTYPGGMTGWIPADSMISHTLKD